jgi:hypothetical protein
MYPVTYYFYLIKAETLSMNNLRFSCVSAMLEYFQDFSPAPPMAIRTFSFGYFCFKLVTFLYWPARQNRQTVSAYIETILTEMKVSHESCAYHLCHHFLLYRGNCRDFELNV